MFFLVDEDVSFPASFPIVFQSGVNMNEAVRQPIELLYPHKYRFSLPFFFQQTSTPLFPANGEPVAGGTDIELIETGLSQIELVAPASST
jgi:hypothetical protein|tara:strand:- start:178 stop:447 length:270 start_codon:yes stop_codon:yes gene_type:complete